MKGAEVERCGGGVNEQPAMESLSAVCQALPHPSSPVDSQ